MKLRVGVWKERKGKEGATAWLILAGDVLLYHVTMNNGEATSPLMDSEES